MWVRFGFSEQLYNQDKFPRKLKFLLAQLWRENYNEELRKLEMRANAVQKICTT